jgi:hypothetical protein
LDKKPALILFLAGCVVLALLLLIRVISFLITGIIFAVLLVVLGGLSGAFRGRNP